jgi:hypothetical protein
MTTTEAHKVLEVITAIIGHPATVGKDYGSGWNGTYYEGYAAQVDDHFAQVRRISPAKTELAASCELLASVRKAYPVKAAESSRRDECIAGMEIYAAYVEAKADAAMAESAERLADMRTPIMQAAE